MQKLWSSRSKRSQPLPPEDQDVSSSAPQDESDDGSQEVAVNSKQDSPNTATNISTNTAIERWSNLWEASAGWLLFALGIGGVVVVAIFGLQYLTAPESTPDSNLACRAKLTGDWQTPFGKISLEEKSGDQVSAKYEYTNFERGRINGEFTGKLRNNVITFDWQENGDRPNNSQTKQQGKGILIFNEGCKEFYGSYGTGDSTNNFGNWQGSRMSK
ncbi:hypothetical protein H6F42_06510 [Pseudanabaena sp. FACHB-1998]|uniref:hypothetical protein n=1 Tax=Pseudanabaena sp. FACHB-1998 TaxID=2692858 RepID=UPI0016811B98|nr:hypothetical protein [Pseudanabaena sp. FACHB-1998]MBD2176565.1 hypothetical protein [Pseudanabaena sp. FACHB-1998]